MSSRRDFVKRAAGASLGLGAGTAGLFPFQELMAAPAVHRGRVRPVAVASGNGMATVARAIEIIAGGGDTLEAVVRGVNIAEEDPSDMTVGYGGLPNADGVVQLDSSVMHGPSRGAGAVAALEGCRTPSLVAVAVMRYTDHVLLVGEGARRFARGMGFRTDEDLLTDAARQEWLRMRATLSDEDDWLRPGESGEAIDRFRRDPATGNRGQDPDPEDPATRLALEKLRQSYDGVRPMGTIHCSAVDTAGNMSGVTTTSGMFYKVPGRVGDSPIIGAGLYTDNDVGSAGSTGRGEAVIKTCGAHTVVEEMRRGASPTDACLEACRRIIRFTVEPRLLHEPGRPNFNVEFYAVNRNGEHGGASIWSGSRYAVATEAGAVLTDAAYVLETA